MHGELARPNPVRTSRKREDFRGISMERTPGSVQASCNSAVRNPEIPENYATSLEEGAGNCWENQKENPQKCHRVFFRGNRRATELTEVVQGWRWGLKEKRGHDLDATVILGTTDVFQLAWVTTGSSMIGTIWRAASSSTRTRTWAGPQGPARDRGRLLRGDPARPCARRTRGGPGPPAADLQASPGLGPHLRRCPGGLVPRTR